MDLLLFLLTIAIAWAIGTIADTISPYDMPGSWAGALVAGYAGTWFGSFLLGSWGPELAGFPLIPVLVGAFIFVTVIGAIKEYFVLND
ncbi:GlsB/YeaQ/YmgE family stress response membrane protein [Sediminibacillus massiliensis]|uniref:GlsB/YeaQ/YmgE family stress response membrane protein n=1 Tax=Sediminibacillus massiliensis TaxID=1926277 RepID=UPI0009883174|nr:GlsB/YeaQ/YmgE family stress response membrane protein [Sediminibacillus massiliensis]